MSHCHCVPDNVFITTLIRTRFHASRGQKAHLLASNDPQLTPKFILILETNGINVQ